jgi:hypothetical protein
MVKVCTKTSVLFSIDSYCVLCDEAVEDGHDCPYETEEVEQKEMENDTET